MHLCQLVAYVKTEGWLHYFVYLMANFFQKFHALCHYVSCCIKLDAEKHDVGAFLKVRCYDVVGKFDQCPRACYELYMPEYIFKYLLSIGTHLLCDLLFLAKKQALIVSFNNLDRFIILLKLSFEIFNSQIITMKLYHVINHLSGLHLSFASDPIVGFKLMMSLEIQKIQLNRL